MQRILVSALALSALIAATAASPAFAADVTPPTPPLGVFVEQGSGWQTGSTLDLWWSNPVDQEAPIAVAHYELCPVVPGGGCTNHQVAEQDIDELSLQLPHPGWFQFRLWLEDAEGNVDPSEKTAPLALRFDNVAPGLAVIEAGDEWRNAADAVELEFVVRLDQWAFVPLSEIAGYALTLDGSTPNGSVGLIATQDNLSYPGSFEFEPQEGETTIKARAISGSGVASNEVGTAVVRVDRSPPTVAATGLPSPGQWSRQPVSIGLTGTDQAGLSGMNAAPGGSPVEDGGHLVYRLDGGSETKARGGQASVEMTEDGEHTLTYAAVDRAGNPSVEKSAEVRIDKTGPTGSFDRQDESDPRRISVTAHDATSGVAAGRIEYRRAGAAGYERLETARSGSKLIARIDDLALADGRYEFRAVVEDHAGNSSAILERAGGQAMALTLPLRAATRIQVEGRSSVKKRCRVAKRAKRGAKKGRSRKRCSKLRIVKGSTIAVPHGKRVASTGLIVSASGEPLRGARVVVEGQLRSGGAFVRLGEVRANDRGVFGYTIPAGASRLVRYRYEGTDTVKPSSAQLTTKVSAAVRIRPSKRRLRNGQVVVFRGLLPGRPIPRAGKLVALQAKVGKRWRTFATPRADARGRFRYRYRFTATTGLRRYVFRAVAAREEAYPYELGVSRPVKVVVRGS